MTPAELESRRVLLRPVSQVDLAFLYALELDQSTEHLWSSRGRTPGPHEYLRLLYQDTFLAMLCVDRARAEPFGVVVAYNANLANGVLWIAATTTRSTHLTGLPIEAVALFADHCISTYRLRRIFFEANETNFAKFGSATTLLCDHHGQYVRHDFVSGDHLDRVIFSVSRAQWEALARPWLVRSIGLPTESVVAAVASEFS